MSDKTYDFTEEHFNVWLNAKPDTAFVGFCQDPERCILAQFLLDHFEIPFEVSERYYWISDREEEIYLLPTWAKKVISDFDAIDEVIGQRDEGVTKADFLTIRALYEGDVIDV